MQRREFLRAVFMGAVGVVDPHLPQWQVRARLHDAGLPVPGTAFRGAEGLWLHELPPSLRSVAPNGGAPTLLQAGHVGSELTGPAFSPDGSRLYFSSQRGPALSWLPRGTGVTYELSIPPEFRRA